MKFLVVALSLFAMAAAAPTSPDVAVEVRRRLSAFEQEEIHDKFGQFALRYVTDERTVVSERSQLVPTANGTEYVIKGEVSYIGDDGRTYVTKYTSGRHGNHVEGNHRPVFVTAKPITALEPINVPTPLK